MRDYAYVSNTFTPLSELPQHTIMFAYDESGKPLTAVKIDTDQWVVSTGRKFTTHGLVQLARSFKVYQWRLVD